MNEIHFEVTSKLDKRVYVTKSRWELIIKTKHLEMEGKEKEVKIQVTENEFNVALLEIKKKGINRGIKIQQDEY